MNRVSLVQKGSTGRRFNEGQEDKSEHLDEWVTFQSGDEHQKVRSKKSQPLDNAQVNDWEKLNEEKRNEWFVLCALIIVSSIVISYLLVIGAGGCVGSTAVVGVALVALVIMAGSLLAAKQVRREDEYFDNKKTDRYMKMLKRRR